MEFQPLPPTDYELLLSLAPACGGSLQAARELGWEMQQLLLAELNHRETQAALQDNLAAALGQPAPDDAAPDAADRLFEYRQSLARANLELIREHCLHHLPLDHPFGEQLDPPPVEEWRDWDGVTQDAYTGPQTWR